MQISSANPAVAILDENLVGTKFFRLGDVVNPHIFSSVKSCSFKVVPSVAAVCGEAP